MEFKCFSYKIVFEEIALGDNHILVTVSAHSSQYFLDVLSYHFLIHIHSPIGFLSLLSEFIPGLFLNLRAFSFLCHWTTGEALPPPPPVPPFLGQAEQLAGSQLPNQGLKPCRPLAVKAESQPLDHWGIPCMLLFILFISPRYVF